MMLLAMTMFLAFLVMLLARTRFNFRHHHHPGAVDSVNAAGTRRCRHAKQSHHQHEEQTLEISYTFHRRNFYNGFNNAEQTSKRFIGWDAQRCS